MKAADLGLIAFFVSFVAVGFAVEHDAKKLPEIQPAAKVEQVQVAKQKCHFVNHIRVCD